MILDMIESRYDDIFNIIHSVIYESVQPSNNSPFWGRLEGQLELHFVMSIKTILNFFSVSDVICL